ncbi:HK97 family phage prohead protease, partial [Clostridioides sp. ZZV14-6345]|nr:HK97 family phage prohead protease [Clostridioides sp. ZZV14-6345]
PATTHGNDLLENVRLGLIKGCSFGFNIVNSKTRFDDEWTYYRDITEVELFEITATPIPAYNDTEINCRSDISIKELRESQKEETKVEEKDNIEKRNVDLVSAFFNAFNQGGK